MKTFKFIVCSLPLFCLFGCELNEKNQEQKDDVIVPVTHDYSEISALALTWNSTFDVELETYYLYFYSPSCSHCVELKDFIIEKALERRDVYFVKSSSEDQFTEDPNKTIGAENPGDIWILGYPSLLKIENKICTKSFAGNGKIINELK